MLTLRDSLMWTIARQGTAPDGQRVFLYCTRTSARHELVVGREAVRSFGPGRTTEALAAYEAAVGPVTRARAA